MTKQANSSDLDDDDKLTPAQAQIVARVRWLMLISGAATVLGIAVVVTVVGYRVFGTEGRPRAAAGPAPGQVSVPVSGPGPVEATARLPKGARVVSVGTAGDRIVVTVDIGGMLEVRIFDVRTLSPEGRLRFVEEP